MNKYYERINIFSIFIETSQISYSRSEVKLSYKLIRKKCFLINIFKNVLFM